MKIDALFISDVHLGSKGSQPDKLLSVLKKYEPEYLFIVGDFIDGWLLKKRNYWVQEYTNVIRKVLSYTKRGTKVIYVTGNHDDFLRDYTPLSLGQNIDVVDEYIWNGVYIVHGDLYDGVVKLRWLGQIGAFGYEMSINIDRFMKRLGIKSSLSSFLKRKVKRAVKFITSFEQQLGYQALLRECNQVVCGHIHKPEHKIISVKDQSIEYINTGDWIENNSWVIYDKGSFSLNILDS